MHHYFSNLVRVRVKVRIRVSPGRVYKNRRFLTGGLGHLLLFVLCREDRFDSAGTFEDRFDSAGTFDGLDPDELMVAIVPSPLP
jgi:hypothetical protein